LVVDRVMRTVTGEALSFAAETADSERATARRPQTARQPPAAWPPEGTRQPRAARLARQSRANGDAFSAAVAEHHGELARFAFRLCGDRVLAEDIVAEAYARVWPHWRRGRVAELLPYLMRAVANEAFTRHRRRRLERTKESPQTPVVADPFEGQVDDHDELWAALDRLAPQHRVILILRVVEDLSEEQTAAMLGIPPGTVKSRLSRALAALRTIVEGNHG